MKKGWKVFVWLCVLFFIAGASLFAFIHFSPEPPVSEIEAARLALVAARNAKAETYANKPFETAQKSYDSAMIAWRTENERFVLNRDFDKVLKLANEATDNAVKAEKQAIAARANLKASLAESITEINEVLNQLNGGLSRFPAPEAITNNIAKGRLLFSEG
ncbi:MAG TPA: hypothetical protein VLH16_03550, partial [Bacteroidales bacterium]|nr:hypothetical protein [Bacteroidales bacterium]